MDVSAGTSPAVNGGSTFRSAVATIRQENDNAQPDATGQPIVIPSCCSLAASPGCCRTSAG